MARFTSRYKNLSVFRGVEKIAQFVEGVFETNDPEVARHIHENSPHANLADGEQLPEAQQEDRQTPQEQADDAASDEDPAGDEKAAQEDAEEVEPAPLDDLHVDQLHEMARDLDIDGRSSMNKADLITAIKEARG